MFLEERQQAILERLKKQKSITVAQLTRELFISPATARRDLCAMEKKGLIRRMHGGAMLLEGSGDERSFWAREKEQVAEKQKIALAAVRLIPDNATLFLDSSSTVGALIPLLREHRNLSVVTTGLQNALLLSRQTQAKLYVTGGEVNSRSNSMTGSDTLEALCRLHADFALISCSGISLENGVTDASLEQARLKGMMLRQAKTKVLLCDSQKFGLTFMCKTCGFEDLDYLVTNSSVHPDLKAKAEAKGCRWMVAED